jgi:hypothetical protein
MEEQKPLEGYSGTEEMTEGQKALETKLKDMTPEQRERLEKMKAIFQEKAEKERWKANMKEMALHKKAKKRAKKEKVARKQRKVNRKKKK